MLYKRLVDVSPLDRFIISVPDDVYDAQSYIRGVEDVLSMIRGMKSENQWISVEDRLPDFDEDVLVTDGFDCAVGFWREDAQAWDSTVFGWLERENCEDEPSRLDKITHWSPLPELNHNEET